MTQKLTFFDRVKRVLFRCISDSDVERLCERAEIEFENGRHVPTFDELCKRHNRISILAGEFSMSTTHFTLSFWAHTRVWAEVKNGDLMPNSMICDHGIGTITHANGSTWKIIITKPILDRLKYWLEI